MLPACARTPLPRIVRLLGIFVLPVLATGQSDQQRILESDFWHKHAVNALAPLWLRHAPDRDHGAYHLSLARDWQPREPSHKIPAMISRQVFGFSAAFLLSGEERYLQAARGGVDYLLAKAWDLRDGGWLDQLTQSGEPLVTTRTASNELYTNVGLTLYYAVTGDERVLDRVLHSVRLRKQKTHDPIHGGYFHVLDRDFTVIRAGKNKHAHYGYVGSLLLNLYLATRDPGILDYSRELSALSLERMRDDDGWLRGFGSLFDREWQLTERKLIAGHEVISIGAQLTAALSLLRLHTQTGETRWLDAGRQLADQVIHVGYNARTGAWLDWIQRAPPNAAAGNATISWWIQIYGSLLFQHLYRIFEDERFLRHFQQTETFFVRHMIDREFGGVFPAVSPAGAPVGKQEKAGPWHTSYHEMEHALLTYVFLKLYVEDAPVVLHFRIVRGGKVHPVAVIDDPRATIAAVSIDGQPWDRFDAGARIIDVPAGENLRVEVTFRRNPE